MDKVRLRLHVIYEYEAQPENYLSTNPEDMAMEDYLILTQEGYPLAEFIGEVDDRVHIAVEALP